MSDEKIDIFPSIMCGKPWELKEYIQAFEEAGVSGIHFDVMDGHYVPNIMLGMDDYQAIRSLTSLPLDIHVMTTNPEGFFNYFLPLSKGDRFCFHPEVCKQPYRLLEKIRREGAKAGIVLSPGEPVSYVKECLGVLDFVLIMAVSPGFAGQTMVPDHLSKISRVHALVSDADHPIEIVIDGNTTVAHATKMVGAGATGLVIGTSSAMAEGPGAFVDLYHDYTNRISDSKN
ncbi:ribulose-phosphate 3-epimerase [Collinsella sp. AGMB00827]|uniref:Ribulose-phosphate 3-epimerase n=1 Tax=Collinsella ureilytica TaxID=2869515 RepID=A0ABS7MII6_9ACTN|nr:ribulose-phosphate 3-epimerase [Collinsella urealyticum]MBY4797062.1 ribulose-phosphate 3-epimerase [Collinsella urealyticum]